MDRNNLEMPSISINNFAIKVDEVIYQVKDQKKPLLLKEGKTAKAVLIGIDEYESLLKKLEMAEKLIISQRQIEEGKVTDHAKVKAMLLRKKMK